jgi:hypothetical protein
LYQVGQIDLDKVILYGAFGEEGGPPIYFGDELFGVGGLRDIDINEAYGGKIALVRGNTFVTEFIFDGFALMEGNKYIPFRHNGKMGLLDADGKMVLPFTLDEFEFIDEDLAFARVGGKFGILSVGKSVAEYNQRGLPQ